jgi:hypothetical protein
MDAAVLEAAAQDAESVALWALVEKRVTPRWRISRRRYLQRVFEQWSAASEQTRISLEVR